jgi:hypothetical protein
MFGKYGLVGTFAMDCTRPVSQQNSYVVYRVLDAGRLQRDWMVEPAKSSASVIVSARELRPNEIEMRIVSGERYTDVVYRVEAKRHRALQSTRDNGEKLVVDGRVVDGGATTNWMNKCK